VSCMSRGKEPISKKRKLTGRDQGTGSPPTSRNNPVTSENYSRPKSNRSRITNGTGLLPGVHRGSLWARRFRDLLNLHLNDMGGVAACSEAEKVLVRRACCLIVELELMETRFCLAPK
jgi:hypothetical protein